MKEKYVVFILFVLACSKVFGQKVGVGTTSPLYKLDVRNGSINTDSVYRIGGITFLSGKAGNCLVAAGDGANITTGIFNVALGLAQEGLSTGSNNVGIGFNALDRNMTGNHNVAIGSRALELCTVSENIAIGKEALSTNTTGNFNTAIGSLA